MKMMQSIKYRMRKRLLELGAAFDSVAAYMYDLRRYLRFSSTAQSSDVHQTSHAAKLTERYHAVEKALSLPEPRPAFGKSVIPRIVELLNSYVGEYGEDDVTRAAAGVLHEYRRFNLTSGVSDDEIPGQPELGRVLTELVPIPAEGVTPFGAVHMRREEVFTAVRPVSLEFFTSRNSTRMYAQIPVSAAEVEFAVRAAMSAPAVCNREFASVTVWTRQERVQEILEAQGGAKGFGYQVPALAMVTVTSRVYWGAAERNQAWIDGGMFAMNFLLGLHAQGLGAVALNWSKDPNQDLAMRKLTELADDRAIIMFVAFGHLLPEYRVAASARRPLSDFLAIDPAPAQALGEISTKARS